MAPEPAGCWTGAQLDALDDAEELEISTVRADGTRRGWTPIWVVRVGENAYVRTWHRRRTGWYGSAVATGRARVRVPGLEAEVLVDDIGAGELGSSAGVAAAFRTKYGRHGAATVERMTSDEATASTLRLVPFSPMT